MKTIETKNTYEVAHELTVLIKQGLRAGKRTLWLISGGSSIPVAYEVSKQLAETDCKNLYITLVDEKVVENDGSVNNFQQLINTGFALECGELIPILKEGFSLSESANAFEANLKEQIETAEFIVGQFGLGEGYHTGGIIAHSSAITDDAYVKYYASDDAKHITITTKVIKLLDSAFINSMGESKKPLVQHFLISEESIDNEPTQALKNAKTTILCSDVL